MRKSWSSKADSIHAIRCFMKPKAFSHLHQVGSRLHRTCPVVSALSDSQVRHQQVSRQVARGKSAIGSVQEGEAWHAAGVGLAFPQSQTVCMQTPARVQRETQD